MMIDGKTNAEIGATDAAETTKDQPVPEPGAELPKQKPGEVGGPQGPEPTRFGDWEVGGRCSDF